MRDAAATMRSEFIGLYGMVERNWYLIKRYAWWEIAFFFWTAANTLTIVFVAIAAFFGLHMPNANFATALVLIAVASVSFVGIGMMTAVLPLISPEKGTQFGYVAQGLMLVVSGVYYPVTVLPAFMQWIAKISPATYALRGERSAILDGATVGQVWGDIWPMVIIGVISVPLGIWVFRRGELHAKRHGKLKRSG